MWHNVIQLVISVPSQAPNGLNLTASSSTSITASWQLPPEIARHGRSIAGFKLFYQKKGSSGLMNMSTINNGATLFEDVTGLEKFTEYKFQVLAFTSDGDGPKSSVKVERTKEDGKRRKAMTAEAAILITLHVYVTGFWDISQDAHQKLTEP